MKIILFLILVHTIALSAALPGFKCTIHLTDLKDINILLPSSLSKMYVPKERAAALKKYIDRGNDEATALKIVDGYDIFKSPIFKSKDGIEHYQINQYQFKKLNVDFKLFKEDGSIFIIKDNDSFPNFKIGVVKDWTDAFKKFNDYEMSPTEIIRSWANWSNVKQEPKSIVKVIKDKLKNKTLISFDLETAGAARTDQITEVYMRKQKISFNGNKVKFQYQDDFKSYINANKKTELEYNNSPVKDNGEGRPSVRKLLEDSSYDWSKRFDHEDEYKVLQKIKTFLTKDPDAIFMAHNAFFDADMINNRFFHHGINYFIEKDRVIDSQIIASYFWIPLKRYSTDKESKRIIKELTVEGDKPLKDGSKRISYSSRLGNINQAITGNDPTNWHEAKADVLAMDEIFESMFEDLASSNVTQEQLVDSGVQKKFSAKVKKQ